MSTGNYSMNDIDYIKSEFAKVNIEIDNEMAQKIYDIRIDFAVAGIGGNFLDALIHIINKPLTAQDIAHLTKQPK